MSKIINEIKGDGLTIGYWDQELQYQGYCRLSAERSPQLGQILTTCDAESGFPREIPGDLNSFLSVATRPSIDIGMEVGRSLKCREDGSIHTWTGREWIVTAPAYPVQTTNQLKKELQITIWNAFQMGSIGATLAAKDGMTLLPVTTVEELDAATKTGCKAVFRAPYAAPDVDTNPASLAGLQASVRSVKDKPGLSGYTLMDEPSIVDFPVLLAYQQRIKEVDPNPDRRFYMNLFPSYATPQQMGVSIPAVGSFSAPDHLLPFLAGSPNSRAYMAYLKKYVDDFNPQVLSYDSYSYGFPGDQHHWWENLEMASFVAKQKGCDLQVIFQACREYISWPQVTEGLLRGQIFSSLAYGAMALTYYIYWGNPPYHETIYKNNKPTPIASTVAWLNKELSVISPWYSSVKKLGTYHTGTLPAATQTLPLDSPLKVITGNNLVVGFFATNTTPDHFLVCNRLHKEEQFVTIKAPNKQLSLLSKFSGKWIVCDLDNLGQFNFILARGDGVFFKIS
jgi:hypothetical protein